MPYQVYLGDTSAELQALRPLLIDQIYQWGMIPLEMSAVEREKPDMLDILKQKITEADYFISIITYKRAWEPSGMGGQSLAEIEYHLALESGKPLAVLLPKENSPMAMYLRLRALGQNPQDALAQQAFWKRVAGAEQVSRFRDEADLSRQLMNLLKAWGAGQESLSEPPTLTRDLSQTFIPETTISVDQFADQVAQRVAEKVQAAQQQEQQALAEQALKLNAALRLVPGELVFGRPSTASQFKSDVFMIMPFAADFSGIYHDIIKPLMGDLKLTIQRGDDFTSPRGSIMEEVWAALNACRFVLAEITGGNDNVFYELGIAHTLNKPAILITQAKTPQEIPFDVRHLRYLIYENTAAGGMKLRDDLQRAITRLLRDLEEEWGNP